jgi:hypothetical protein
MRLVWSKPIEVVLIEPTSTYAMKHIRPQAQAFIGHEVFPTIVLQLI